MWHISILNPYFCQKQPAEVFLEISQNSQESTSASFFLNKVASLGPYTTVARDSIVSIVNFL